MSEKKAPGRPPMKKGKSTWKPASLNVFTGKEDGFVYRMSRKDPDNLAKKEQEGWETVSNLNSAGVNHVDPGRIHDGKALTSVTEGRDWVLQRIPEEMAQARHEYFDEKSQKQVHGITAHIKSEMKNKGMNAPLHGNITISSRKGEQVIEV